MRYRDLGIETQRETPANSRTVGIALLLRAGYRTRDGRETLLGQEALARLENCSKEKGDFFIACKLPIIRGEADQTFITVKNGRLDILHCSSCGYAAEVETARIKKNNGTNEDLLPIEKVRTPGCDTIDSLASFLNIPTEKTAKALMYTRQVDGKFIFVVVNGNRQVSEAKLRRLLGEIRVASAQEITTAGAVAGYASPISLRDGLIVVDDLIPFSANLDAGANEEGYHLKNTNFDRDYRAGIVADLIRAQAGDPCINCGCPLSNMNVELLADETGYRFGNILTALAEVHHDDKGLTFPARVAPIDVELLYLPSKFGATHTKSEELYLNLTGAGFSVLFDDREERAGVKFNDADLIGCPIRITVGEKNLGNGMVELKPRKSLDTRLVPFSGVVDAVQSYFNSNE